MGFISYNYSICLPPGIKNSAKTMTPSSLHDGLTANITPKLKKQNGNISIENDWLTLLILLIFFFGQAYLSANKHWFVGCKLTLMAKEGMAPGKIWNSCFS